MKNKKSNKSKNKVEIENKIKVDEKKKIDDKKEVKSEVREIPGKNYVKLSCIFIITIAVVLIVYIAFQSHMKFIKSIPIIRGNVSEIVEKDLDTYFNENDDFLLYIGVADDENCREFEEALVPMLKKKNITNVVYLNITDVENKVDFFESFNSKYSNYIKVSNYPAFVIIEDKMIVDLVEKGDKYLNVTDVDRLLEEYEIIGDVK